MHTFVRAVRLAAWAGGGAVATAWLAVALALAAGLGQPGLLTVLTAAGSAVLAGRLAALNLRRLLARAWEPVETHVSLTDVATFRRRVCRRSRWRGYRVLAEARGHVTLAFRGRTETVLAPLCVRWERDGARLTGPRALVRLALRQAV